MKSWFNKNHIYLYKMNWVIGSQDSIESPDLKIYLSPNWFPGISRVAEKFITYFHLRKAWVGLWEFCNRSGHFSGDPGVWHGLSSIPRVLCSTIEGTQKCLKSQRQNEPWKNKHISVTYYCKTGIQKLLQKLLQKTATKPPHFLQTF